jgi:hypothetical protein
LIAGTLTFSTAARRREHRRSASSRPSAFALAAGVRLSQATANLLVDCARYLWDADDLWVLATSAATAAATGIVVGLAAFERKPIERSLRR